MARSRVRKPQALTHSALSSDKIKLAAAGTIVVGLLLIILGNAFKQKFVGVDLETAVSNIGALMLIIGTTQVLYDAFVRHQLFADLRSTILGLQSVENSGIVSFESDSKDADLTDLFLKSAKIAIGTNYSSKVLEHWTSQIKQRSTRTCSIRIMYVKEGSETQTYISKLYGPIDGMKSSITKIEEITNSLRNEKTIITTHEIDRFLAYSFIEFDNAIWIVPGTNGPGRRPVPGFLVEEGSPWYEHYTSDIAAMFGVGVLRQGPSI